MRIPALAAALLLAGCITPEPTPPADPGATEPTFPAAFTMGNDASGCYEAILVLLLDLADAQARLPRNWTAADAQALLATPAPTGQGAVWLNGYHCATSQMEGGAMHGAEMGILVQAPTVAGGEAEPAALHLYEFAQATPGSNAQRMLASVGVPYIQARVEASFQTVAAVHEGELSVVNENGTLYSFSYAALAAAPMTTSANFWHQAAEGLAYYHFGLVDVPAFQGAATACSLDGLAAELAGADACLPGRSLAMVFPEQAWTSGFHWLPGAHATAA